MEAVTGHAHRTENTSSLYKHVFWNSDSKEVYVYCDASEHAIAAVGYLLAKSKDQNALGFILGKAKVASSHGHTILELWAAVMSTEIALIISEQLDIDLSKTDEESSEENLYELQNPDNDKEVRSLVTCQRNSHAAPNLSLGSHRFSEFQNWKNLIETNARLRHVVQSFKREGPCTGWHSCKLIKSISSYKEAEKFDEKVVEEMSASSFINAYRRFVALRGPVKQIRSDRGTNFVGSTDDLNINTNNVEDGQVKSILYENGTT